MGDVRYLRYYLKEQNLYKLDVIHSDRCIISFTEPMLKVPDKAGFKYIIDNKRKHWDEAVYGY